MTKPKESKAKKNIILGMTQTTSQFRSSPIGQLIVAIPQPHTNDNPLWQGPCGGGANGGVTQSMLARFFSCRERFRLKYVLGLEPHDKWNHRLGYGNMWHVCEEALAESNNSDSVDKCLARLQGHTMQMGIKYPLQQEEITKWFNVCYVQFPEYAKYWSEHPDVKNRTPLIQEQVFDVPYTLPSGRVVRLRGKWDSVDLIREESEGLLGKHKQVSEGIWQQENKTKGDIDKIQVERQLKFDLQTLVYQVALIEFQKLYSGKIAKTWPIMGVRYNVVRRPLSGGKGNIKPHSAKATKTKYTPAETEEHFYERLRSDYIAKEPDYWFFRVKAEITPQDIEVFKRTCLDPLLDQLCWWYEEVTGNHEHQRVKGVINAPWSPPPMNYRTPFGIYSALEEGGTTEYDYFLETGSEATLRRVDKLFPEL